MKLGEFIKQYRETHGMSMRSFSSNAGLSVQYISNLEKGINNDGKPLKGTSMPVYDKIAKAVGMSTIDLLLILDDNVKINPDANKRDGVKNELHSIIDILTDEEACILLDYINSNVRIKG